MARKSKGGVCMGCGTPLKAKWLGCPRCLRPRVAGQAAGKVVGGLLVKSAGSRCGRCGAVSRRAGNRFCTSQRTKAWPGSA